jgi:hypothetical protein
VAVVPFRVAITASAPTIIVPVTVALARPSAIPAAASSKFIVPRAWGAVATAVVVVSVAVASTLGITRVRITAAVAGVASSYIC